MNDSSELVVALLPSIPFTQRHLLPECPGIYFAVSEKSTLLYIGQTRNLHDRWIRHHRMQQLIEHECIFIKWYICSLDQLHTLEAQFIRQFQPLLNVVSVPLPATYKAKVSLDNRHMKRTTIVLSDPQYDAMHTLAKKRDLPFSELVRRAIDVYLRHQRQMESGLPDACDTNLNTKESDHA
jgi:GIY-YIG catalytic domain